MIAGKKIDSGNWAVGTQEIIVASIAPEAACQNAELRGKTFSGRRGIDLPVTRKSVSWKRSPQES